MPVAQHAVAQHAVVSRRLVAGIAAAALSMLPVQAFALARTDVGVSGYAEAAALGEGAAAVATEATRPEVAGHEDLRARAAQNQEREQKRDPADDRFAERWPAQVAAGQDVRRPDTTRWALLIGINEHLGTVRDNVGSAQDAKDLREFLLRQGWRDDHIVLITDTEATRDNLLAGMRWLSTKTTADSVAIFHYSGHSKKWYDEDHDGDGEITDEGLWPTDDKFIVDSELVANLQGVDGQFWLNIGACNSAGFNDPGLARDGRLLTFSSAETEKSYEDPSVDNSVWGYHLFDEAMLQGHGDTDGNGKITVEEAFAFAKPRAATRTDGQRYGRQNAVIVDRLAGDFSFEIPPPPPEPKAEAEPEPEEADDEGGLLCPIICSGRTSEVLRLR